MNTSLEESFFPLTQLPRVYTIPLADFRYWNLSFQMLSKNLHLLMRRKILLTFSADIAAPLVAIQHQSIAYFFLLEVLPNQKQFTSSFKATVLDHVAMTLWLKVPRLQYCV